MLETYTDWLLRRHRIVVLVTLLAALLLSTGAARLTFTNDLRAYFSEDNPQFVAFKALEHSFIKQDTLRFFIVARDGDVFDRKTLTLVTELTAFGWQVPYSLRVNSLANFQHSHAEGDDLFVSDLISDPAQLDSLARARIKEIALAEPALVNRVVAADGTATAIEVFLSLPEGDPNANDDVVTFARSQLPALRARFPDVDILLGGDAPYNVAIGDAVQRDLRTLVALSYAVVVIGLLLLLRQGGGIVGTLVVVSLSIASTMGVFGWFDTSLTAVAGFVPSIVMTLAVADSVHILVTYSYELHRGRPKQAAIRESMRVNAMPVFITSVTTIIGVLTLNFSDSPPYRDLGNMIAVGIAFAYVLSMTFLPAFLAWAPSGRMSRVQTLERLMSRFAEWVIYRSRRLLFAVGVVLAMVTSFIPQNELTERWHDYFDTTFEIRRTVDTVNEHFGGIHVIRYVLESGVDQGIHEPKYMQAVEQFADWYRRQPGVNYVGQLSDVIKKLNMNMHADDPAWYRLPESRELMAQYLLVYELALPRGLGLETTINWSRSATQFIAVVKKTDSEQLLALDRHAREWLETNAPWIQVTEGTGIDMVFAHINHRNIRSLLGGMALALVLISLLLMVAFRSVKIGLLALITNLAPVGLAYGTWGLFVGRVDLAASVVICMSIGIVVDDTVHFLSKYLMARRQWRLDAAGGMRYAFNTVGVALFITTAVLVSGFLVLSASHFSPTWVVGVLLATTLAYALVIDFLFLPPLLLTLEKRWHLRY